jgi:hypothetical protein
MALACHSRPRAAKPHRAIGNPAEDFAEGDVMNIDAFGAPIAGSRITQSGFAGCGPG